MLFNMQLLAIKERFGENEAFTSNPFCRETVEAMAAFYKKVGFVQPWIGYYVEENGNLVGSAGFKGPPVSGAVEIAYGTMEQYRNQGFGTAICRLLVDLSLKTDPSIRITARTFLKENFSTRILVKNNFICLGTVNDPEDGAVWEWLFQAYQ